MIFRYNSSNNCIRYFCFPSKNSVPLIGWSDRSACLFSLHLNRWVVFLNLVCEGLQKYNYFPVHFVLTFQQLFVIICFSSIIFDLTVIHSFMPVRGRNKGSNHITISCMVPLLVRSWLNVCRYIGNIT